VAPLRPFEVNKKLGWCRPARWWFAFKLIQTAIPNYIDLNYNGSVGGHWEAGRIAVHWQVGRRLGSTLVRMVEG
jgi:hypothetical protein